MEFVERNVAADPTALAELEGMGYHTTPVTLVNGEAVVGYDAEKLSALLHLRKEA